MFPERWHLLRLIRLLRLRQMLKLEMLQLLLVRFLLVGRSSLLQTENPTKTTTTAQQPLSTCKAYPLADGLATMPVIAKEQKNWYSIERGKFQAHLHHQTRICFILSVV